VLPDTLTADGRSEAQVLGGPVSDRYGNPVPQYPVTVAVSAGEVHAVDEDPAPGIQRRTDPAGQFTAVVRAANNPALAQISATTAPGGTAAGGASIAFLPRSTFAIGIAAPSAAVPGDTLAFRVPITNLGPSAVAFGASTRFQLQDPDGSQVTTTLTGPVVIGPGEAGELDFQPVEIDTALVPGRYTPLVRLIGTDAHGAPVDTAIAGPFESFAIDVVRIESVLAPPRVSRGQVGVEVRIVARNRGASSLLVTDLGLDFSAPAYTVGNSSPPMPDALGPGEQVTYTVLVAVDPLATLGPVAIDARLEFEAGGRPHQAAGAALPTQWTVEPAADLRYVAASLAPRVVSVGQQHLTAVVVQNLGSAAVVLDPALTQLDFGPPGNQLPTPLLAPAVVPGFGSTLLKFTDLQVPGNYPVGPAPVALTLGGLENGAPFAAASTLPDSVTVQAAATLEAIAGSLAPDSVAVGQTRNFSLTIANHGGAGVTLEAGTRLRLTGAPGMLELALAAPPVTIPAAGQTALAFTPAVIPADLGSGPAAVELALVLIENGLPATQVVPVPDPVTVLEPAILRFVGQSLAPARVTRGQPAAFALTVANDGQAPVTILGGSRLRVTDGVHELAIVYAGPERMVPGGGGTVALSLPSAVVPIDLAAQSYAPILELATIELGIAGMRTAVAPASELTVQAPVDARYVPGTIAPELATAGQVVAFQVEIENRGGATFVPDPTTRFAFGGFSADLDPARAPAIAGGATDTLFFLPEALASAETGVFSPQVMLAGSDANGAPVTVTLPLAPDQVTVVSGAALRVERLLSTAPRGARVNRGQAISLAVVVANRGEEAVSGATLHLAGPGLAGPRSAAVGALAPGDSAALLVPAVAAAGTGPALVTATLQGGTGAISGLPPFLLPALDDTLTLAIERAAALRPAIALSAPSGAQDGVASGGSLLDLEVLVQNQGDAPIDEQGEVTLSVPAGYGILGPAAQALVPATPIRFAVATPAAGAAPDSIRIAISALPHDLNSGAPAQILATGAAIQIATVTPARLEVALAIVAPGAGSDGRSPGHQPGSSGGVGSWNAPPPARPGARARARRVRGSSVHGGSAGRVPRAGRDRSRSAARLHGRDRRRAPRREHGAGVSRGPIPSAGLARHPGGGSAGGGIAARGERAHGGARRDAGGRHRLHGPEPGPGRSEPDPGPRVDRPRPAQAHRGGRRPLAGRARGGGDGAARDGARAGRAPARPGRRPGCRRLGPGGRRPAAAHAFRHPPRDRAPELRDARDRGRERSRRQLPARPRGRAGVHALESAGGRAGVGGDRRRRAALVGLHPHRIGAGRSQSVHARQATGGDRLCPRGRRIGGDRDLHLAR
jgi:hypothetical protein